ncbi:L-fuculose-phosphate aldolase [Cladophialophora yegresii CBS 114405]|uniref:L-fuculose-phosphate aldolase n=1 Tax=Cladophialophora yegresii CBS 114405 TaxID=1182544 RepID=W9W9L3_9EURO|nr:L-fuculose-phosphate aldolase [Cladophialophora yegresii CBS 114405]EXJ64628.1 L-fuculose-phosphate aldolase [Cladophialophora yegresii CBS 114405]
MAPSAISDLLPSVPVASKSANPQDAEKHVHGMEDKSPLAAISHGDVMLPGIPKFGNDFAAQRQWQLEHMAAAFRHWAREGFVEGISGHISVRDPESHEVFWTNPLGVHFGLLKASDMIAVNLDGKVVGGNRTRPPNAAGFLIHSEVHKARPDVTAICHAHTVYGKAWSVFGRPLEMLTQDACKFYKAHSVYNSYGGVVLASEEGAQIAQALGPTNKACILRNHGLLTVGKTVDEAAFLFTSMEHACQGQLLAEAAAQGGGLKKVLISEEEAAYTNKMESDEETCYAEFQVYIDWEDHHSKGDFRK